MITPVLRMVEAALNHVTLGVNAQIDSMIMDGTDAPPAHPTIINSADDDEAVTPDSAGGMPINNWPALVIAADTPAQVTVTGVVGKAFDVPHFILLIPYITGETIQPAQAWRDADYTFRAAILALNYALLASNTGPARVRGKVEIVKHNNMTYGPAFTELKQGRMIGLLNLDLWVRVLP